MTLHRIRCTRSEPTATHPRATDTPRGEQECVTDLRRVLQGNALTTPERHPDQPGHTNDCRPTHRPQHHSREYGDQRQEHAQQQANANAAYGETLARIWNVPSHSVRGTRAPMLPHQIEIDQAKPDTHHVKTARALMITPVPALGFADLICESASSRTGFIAELHPAWARHLQSPTEGTPVKIND